MRIPPIYADGGRSDFGDRNLAGDQTHGDPADDGTGPRSWVSEYRQTMSMTRRLIILLGAIALTVAACGSNGRGGDAGGGSSGSGKGAGGLVAKVAKAKIKVTNGTAVATTTISVGGAAGKHVTLEWGLIDALQGGESQAEIVIHRYISTKVVKHYPAAVRIKMSTIFNPSLVHFVLYGPDGSFLSSSDTPDFGGQ
jgi:hypothetical protein